MPYGVRSTTCTISISARWSAARSTASLSARCDAAVPSTATRMRLYTVAPRSLLGPHEGMVGLRARALDSRRNAIGNEEEPAHPHVVALRAGPRERPAQARAHQVDPGLPGLPLLRGDGLAQTLRQEPVGLEVVARRLFVLTQGLEHAFGDPAVGSQDKPPPRRPPAPPPTP